MTSTNSSFRKSQTNTKSPLGVIFDLDGTLVDSGLDFDQIRREMGLPHGTPILETLDSLEVEHHRRCREILDQHESAGAERATRMPSAAEFLAALDERAIRRAVVTRNSRPLALAVLDRLALHFDQVVAREDGPVKPDPAAIRSICAQWQISPADVLMVGDFRFDIEAGHRAGTRTALYTRGRDPQGLPGADQADLCWRSFDEALVWLRMTQG